MMTQVNAKAEKATILHHQSTATTRDGPDGHKDDTAGMVDQMPGSISSVQIQVILKEANSIVPDLVPTFTVASCRHIQR